MIESNTSPPRIRLGRLEHRVEGLGVSNRLLGRRALEVPALVDLPALLLGTLFLSPTVLGGYYTPDVKADNGDYYSEALVGFVDTNGVAYIGTVFADSQLSIG